MRDQHYTINNPATPVQVAPAQTSGNSVVLVNEGASACWVGGPAVTAGLGLPLAPGAQLDWSNLAEPLYVVADPGSAETITATTNEAVTAGYDRVTVVTGGDQFTVGMWVLIEDGTLSEVVGPVSNSTTGIVIFNPNTCRFPHASGVTLVGTAGSSTQVHVVAGN